MSDERLAAVVYSTESGKAPIDAIADQLNQAHLWIRDIRKGMPVLRCSECQYIWWPDRQGPKRGCQTQRKYH